MSDRTGDRNKDERLRSEVFVKSGDKCNMVRQFLCLIYLVTSVIGTKKGAMSIGLDGRNGMMRDGNFRVFKSESLDAIESNTSANLSGLENCLEEIEIKEAFIGSGMNVVLSNNESDIERNNDENTNEYINKNKNMNKNIIVTINNVNTLVEINNINKIVEIKNINNIVTINNINKIVMNNRDNIMTESCEKCKEKEPRSYKLEGSIRRSEKPRVNQTLVGSDGSTDKGKGKSADAQMDKSAKERGIEKSSGEKRGELAGEGFPSSACFPSSVGFPSMGIKKKQKPPENEERGGALSRIWSLSTEGVKCANAKTDGLTTSAGYREGVEKVNERATKGEVGNVAGVHENHKINVNNSNKNNIISDKNNIISDKINVNNSIKNNFKNDKINNNNNNNNISNNINNNSNCKSNNNNSSNHNNNNSSNNSSSNNSSNSNNDDSRVNSDKRLKNMNNNRHNSIMERSKDEKRLRCNTETKGI